MVKNFGHLMIEHIPDDIRNTLYTVNDICVKLDKLCADANECKNNMIHPIYRLTRLVSRVINAYGYYGENRSFIKDQDKVKEIDKTFKSLIDSFSAAVEYIELIIEDSHNLQPEIVKLTQEKTHKLFEMLEAKRIAVNDFVNECVLKSVIYQMSFNASIRKEN